MVLIFFRHIRQNQLEAKLKDLSLANSHVFLHLSDCVHHVAAITQRACRHLDTFMQQHLPVSIEALSAFPAQSQELLNEQRLNRMMAAHSGSLAQLLSIPHLVQTCLAHQQWESALDLITFVDQLWRRHPHIPALVHLHNICGVHASSLNATLLGALASPTLGRPDAPGTSAGARGKLWLGHALRVAGLLRRMGLCTEATMRRAFLDGQTARLRAAAAELYASVTTPGGAVSPGPSVLPVAPGAPTTTGRLLGVLAEILRRNVIDTVTAYSALFGRDAGARGSAPLAAAFEKSTASPAAAALVSAESDRTSAAVATANGPLLGEWVNALRAVTPENLDASPAPALSPPPQSSAPAAPQYLEDGGAELIRLFQTWRRLAASTGGVISSPLAGDLTAAATDAQQCMLNDAYSPAAYGAFMSALRGADDAAAAAAAASSSATQPTGDGAGVWGWASFADMPLASSRQPSAGSILGALPPAEQYADEDALLTSGFVAPAALLASAAGSLVLLGRRGAAAAGDGTLSDGFALQRWVSTHVVAFASLLARVLGSSQYAALATALPDACRLTDTLNALVPLTPTIASATTTQPWWLPVASPPSLMPSPLVQASVGQLPPALAVFFTTSSSGGAGGGGDAALAAVEALAPSDIADLGASLRHCAASLSRVAAECGALFEALLAAGAFAVWRSALADAARRCTAQVARFRWDTALRGEGGTGSGSEGDEGTAAAAASAGAAIEGVDGAGWAAALGVEVPPVLVHFGPLMGLAQAVLHAIVELRSACVLVANAVGRGVGRGVTPLWYSKPSRGRPRHNTDDHSKG